MNTVERIPITDLREVSIRGTRSRVPKVRAIVSGGLTGGVIAVLVACGGGGKNEVKAAGNENLITPVATLVAPASATETPAVKLPQVGGSEPTPVSNPTATATLELPKPKPVPPEEAKPILGADFVLTTFETVEQSINSAYEEYPDAYDFLSQSRKFPKSDIDRLLGACGTGILDGRPSDSKVECAMLVRVFYGHYLQSGRIAFHQAAVNVFNFFRTRHPGSFSSGPLPFIEIVEGELKLNGLPTK